MEQAQVAEPEVGPTAAEWAAPGVGVLRDLRSALARVCDDVSSAVASQDRQARLVGLRRAADRIEALWLQEVADFDAVDGAQAVGATSTQAFLRHAFRLSPGDASERVRAARVLSGSLTDTSDALRDGSVSLRHAAVIADTARGRDIDEQKTIETSLLDAAKVLDPMALRRAAQHLTYVLDPDAADQAAISRYERRGVTLAETLGGMVSISGLLDAVGGATLISAVDALTRPPCQPASEPSEALRDDRSWAQRRADALVELATRSLDAGDLPQVAGQRPHLVVTLDLPTLTRAAGAGAADAAWVGPISAEEARQLACDAEVVRVITDAPSQILDVGRATRTIPPALRTAITLRDGSCIATGCTTAAVHCDVHHVRHWADGGSTSLDNCALVCRWHHTWLHRYGWVVTRTARGAFRIDPPHAKADHGPD
jgi:hypothetical protein